MVTPEEVVAHARLSGASAVETDGLVRNAARQARAIIRMIGTPSVYRKIEGMEPPWKLFPLNGKNREDELE